MRRGFALDHVGPTPLAERPSIAGLGGGTGRHTILRWWRRKAWEFEPPPRQAGTRRHPSRGAAVSFCGPSADAERVPRVPLFCGRGGPGRRTQQRTPRTAANPLRHRPSGKQPSPCSCGRPELCPNPSGVQAGAPWRGREGLPNRRVLGSSADGPSTRTTEGNATVGMGERREEAEGVRLDLGAGVRAWPTSAGLRVAPESAHLGKTN